MVLLIQLVLLLHLRVVHLIESSSANNASEAERNTTEEALLKEQKLQLWQSRLAQISGDVPWTGSCLCDRTASYCDLECCCDGDCSQLQKYAFSRCQDSSASNNEGAVFSCPSTRPFYRKQFHLGQQQSSRLLCLSRDNTGKRQLFANLKTISDSGKLATIKPRHEYKWAAMNHSNWLTSPIGGQHVKGGQVKSMLEYKSGSALIWTFTQEKSANGSTHWLDYWRLPSALYSPSGKCNHLQAVNYMHPFSSDCLLPLQDLKTTCTTEKQLDVDSYNKGKLFHYYNFVKGEYRTVPVHLEAVYGKVLFNQTLQTCANVVAAIEYTLWHEGIFGIIKVTLKVRQIELTNSTRALRQTFAVNFKWAGNFSKENPSFGGQSGYLHKQKLAFAQKRRNESLELVEKQLVGNYRLGLCATDKEISKNMFRFGINRFTSCRLRVHMQSIAKAQLCSTLESVISQYFNSSLVNLFVSTYGNGSSAFNNSEEFAPILLSDSRSSGEQLLLCGHPWQGASWQIFYSKVGLKDRPVLRVVGASVQRHQLSGLKSDCSRDMCSLTLDTELFSSLDFIDVTEPLRPDYAPAPSVRIELPSDFFYPFQTNSHSTDLLIKWPLVIVLLAIVQMQLYCPP